MTYTRRAITLFAVIVPFAALAAACGAKKEEAPAQKPLTQREKDSILGANRYIPGAQGVQKAMRAADSLNARTRRSDSVGRGDTVPAPQPR
jgi:hypothetical protein